MKNEGVISDFANIPYIGYADQFGWEAFYQMVVSQCKQHSFEVVYFHYFHRKGTPSPRHCINALRSLPNSPTIITSAGDGFSDNWMRIDYPEDFKEASRCCDITFSTQMGRAADKIMAWGARNVVYVPNSMCQVRFSTYEIIPEKHQFDFDVVFIGSNNGNALFNPISKHWWGAKERNFLVKKLYKRYGNRFGLFGKGWNYSCAQGPVPFDKQQLTYQRGRIVVGGNPYSYSDYYSSNRIFFEISSGIPTVELYVPRLDQVLRGNEHCYFAANVNELIKECDRLLNSDSSTLYKKAAEAAKYIKERHTQYHRMKFKINTVKSFRQNKGKLNIEFPFFLPEVDLKNENGFAIKTSV